MKIIFSHTFSLPHITRPYRKKLLKVTALGFVNVLLDCLLLLLLFDFLKLLIHQNIDDLFIYKKLVAKIASWRDISLAKMLIFNALLLILIAAMRLCIYLYYEFKKSHLRGCALEDLQSILLKLYLKAPWTYLVSKKSGELLSEINTSAFKASEILNYAAIARSASGLIIIFSILLFIISPLLFFIGFVLSGFYFIAILLLGRRISYRSGKGRVKATRTQNVIAAEALSGMRYLRAYNFETNWMRRFNTTVREYVQLMVKDDFLINAPNKILEFFVISILLSFTVVLTVFSGQNFVNQIPALGAYFFGIFRLLPALSQWGSSNINIQAALPYALSIEKKIQELHTDHEAQNSAHEMDVPKPPLMIQFDQVSFSYGENNLKILENKTFLIQPNKINILYGESGCGKSTTLDLILSFIQPTSGNIFINNNVPLSKIDKKIWRQHIALVGQDVFLFHDTILNNLKLGNMTASFEQVEELSKYMEIYAYIISLPEGWDTLVGDRGVKLSGGQRQRISLVRALLRNPSIYLLDEATSALDIETEKKVLKKFLDYTKGKTIVLVSHRPEILNLADHVIRFDIQNSNHYFERNNTLNREL